MLLNEFLKEHRKGEEQERKIDKLEATLAQLESLLSQQNAQIQKWRKLTAGKTPPASDPNSSLAAR